MGRYLKVKELDKTCLSNAEYLSFMHAVFNFIPSVDGKPFGPEKDPTLIGIPPELYERLKQEVDKLQTICDITLTAEETAEAAAREGMRDKLVNYVLTRITSSSTSPLETERRAGEALIPVVAPFAELTQKSSDEESEIIDKMLDMLASEKNAPHVTTLGLDKYLTEIKKVNDSYKATYLKRMKDISAMKQRESGYKLRQIIDDAFEDLTLIVQSYHALRPTPASRDFINILNEEITQKAASIKRRETYRRKREEKQRAIANGEPLPPSKPRKKRRKKRY